MIDVVCGVLKDAEGRYLACLRPDGKALGGRWEFPGGKVECGESPEGALIRELKEELDVVVEVGSPLGQVIWNYEGLVIRLLPFHCKIVDGVPQALEHTALLWCFSGNFHDLPWADADLPILHEIAESDRAAQAGTSLIDTPA
jgi:8-oxo-dGTP diphosphatase